MSDNASFTRQCYTHIMNHILRGRLKPGDEINRQEIAQSVGSSVAPVNEALGQLRTEGFVEVTPRRGTRVRSIRREDLYGLLIVREALECEAARLYCGRPVREARERLLALAEELDGSKAGSPENEQGEVLLHQALVALTGCRILIEEHEKIMRRRLFFRLGIVMPTTIDKSIDRHSRLIANLEIDDADRAEAEMRRHLEIGRAGIAESL